MLTLPSSAPPPSGQIPDTLAPIRPVLAGFLSSPWLWVVRGVFIAGLLLCAALYLYYRRRNQP